MIGVIASSEEHDVVCEFFELFKTPWELYRPGGRYEVLLCSGEREARAATAKLVVVYSAEPVSLDGQSKIQSQKTTTTLAYMGQPIPIYGKSLTFRDEGIGTLVDRTSGAPAAYMIQSENGAIARVGYDLFREIRAALTEGQPPANAEIPVVEMHIAVLRDLVLESAGPLVEIPPVPDGYGFIACLTHDVDHPSIRRHQWDHTMFGFLYRAVVGSVRNTITGRCSLRSLITNWTAALKLPLVHSGLASDFWLAFDRYPDIEGRLGSTFFIIPFEGRPGQTVLGEAPKSRASSYGAREIEDQIRTLMAAGCEIGVHGIDSWLDSLKGGEELAEIVRVTGVPGVGVRMHWLYFNEESPAHLERAGFAYDSSVGYNETIGYRAGTGQVFKPLGAARLLELPMHVMDTALFYPRYLDLSPSEAGKRVGALIDNALRFGGAVTVNWHDRSIAPERLWQECYLRLIEDLRSKSPWFATASRTVGWFRKRRSASFETVTYGAGSLRAKVSMSDGDDLPGLRLRVHKARSPRKIRWSDGAPASSEYVDIGLNAPLDTCVHI